MNATLCLLLQVAAPDVRVLGGVDFFGVTAQAPSNDTFADAEIGYGLRVDVRHLKDIDLRLDYRDREGLTGNDSRHELHNLSLLWHGPVVDVTVGRFPVAGDFWLINDGVRVAGHPRSDLTIEGYAGLRAFTSGRENADLSDDPVALPLVGAGVAIDRAELHASLYGTYTQDSIRFYRGSSMPLDPNSDANVDTVTRASASAAYIDGSIVWLPRQDVFAAGGFTLGSRYPVQFSSMPGMFTAPPSVETDILGSIMTYALVEWSPSKNVRVGYAFDFDRVQVFVGDLPLDNTMTAAGGSFEDHTVKASWRIWRSLRLEVRDRLRFRETTDIIDRIEVGARGDNLVGDFGAFVNFGADLWDEHPGLGQRDIYTVTGGISYVRPWFDARAGVLYTDAIGNGVAFSTHAQQAMGAGPTSELFPLVLDAQRIGFLRLFGIAHPTFLGDADLFFGLDTEFNFGGSSEGLPDQPISMREQLRMLFQLGYAR